MWMQLVNAMLSNWKNSFRRSNNYSQNLILSDHHLLKSLFLFNIEERDSKELYCIINFSRNSKPLCKYSLQKILIRRN